MKSYTHTCLWSAFPQNSLRLPLLIRPTNNEQNFSKIISFDFNYVIRVNLAEISCVNSIFQDVKILLAVRLMQTRKYHMIANSITFIGMASSCVQCSQGQEVLQKGMRRASEQCGQVRRNMRLCTEHVCIHVHGLENRNENTTNNTLVVTYLINAHLLKST